MSSAMLSNNASSRRKILWSTGDFLWHGTMLVAICMITSAIFWGTWQFWIFEERRLFLALVAVAYFAGLGVSSRVLGFARANILASVFVALSFSFLLLVLWLALGRIYYSRSFLLIVYLLALSVQLVSHIYMSRRSLRLALIPGGLTNELSALPGVQWIKLATPKDDFEAQGIVIDPHFMTAPNWVRFVAENSLRGRSVFHAAAIYEELTGQVSLEHHSESWLESLSLPPVYPVFKRIIDLGLVILLAPLSLIVIGIIGVLVKLDSPGGVLFWQERVGQGEKPFRMVKFRTMHKNSEQDGSQFAADNDPRITSLGRFLRKYRLDELPQLWNVLVGNMSLIGPRPEQTKFAEIFASDMPLYSYRHLVKPGLTGWAQVNQGYTDDSAGTQVKLTYDLYYVKHLSIWLDILIVLKTIKTILSGFGSR